MSNPFETAIQSAKAREAAAAKLRQEQEAVAAAQRQTLAAQLAERWEEADRKRTVEDFITGFFAAVVKAAVTAGWSSAALEAAHEYCTAITSIDDVDIPTIDPSMGRKIHDKFVYGIILKGDRLPVNHLVGQRTDWFAELFAKETAKNDRLNIRPGDRPRVMYSSTTTTPVVDLPEAITPKAKGKDGRPMGTPGRQKVTAAA